MAAALVRGRRPVVKTVYGYSVLYRQRAAFPGSSGRPDEKIAGIAESRKYRRGEAVFSDGDTADGFYIPMTGRVKIFKLSADGREQVLHIMGFQEPFGEVPVFAGGRFRPTPRPSRKAFFSSFPAPRSSAS